MLRKNSSEQKKDRKKRPGFVMHSGNAILSNLHSFSKKLLNQWALQSLTEKKKKKKSKAKQIEV